MLGRMKTRATCKREFRPSSKHRDCPACRAIAAKHPCPGCGVLVRRRSKACRTCFMPVNHTGANNPNWKGDNARHKNKAGYVYVRCVDHPRGVRNGGYVFEHIIVMEALLGRMLLPGE